VNNKVVVYKNETVHFERTKKLDSRAVATRTTRIVFSIIMSTPSNPSPPPKQKPEKPENDDDEVGKNVLEESSPATLVVAPSPTPPAPSRSSNNTASNVVENNNSNTPALSTPDSLCLGVQTIACWSNDEDDDSVYTQDHGIATPTGPAAAPGGKKENKPSPSLLANNEPLDFGSIFRTIHAIRCPPTAAQAGQVEDKDKDDAGARGAGGAGAGAGAGAVKNEQQGGQPLDEKPSLAEASSSVALDSSFGAYDDTSTDVDDTVTSSTAEEQGGYATKLSYTRSFLEQMTSGDSCASAGSSSSNLDGNNNTNNKLNLTSTPRSSPFPAASSATILLAGASSLALDLTTTDEEEEDSSNAYDSSNASHLGYGGYDSTLYSFDEESNANISMQTAKTPVTKNGGYSCCSKNNTTRSKNTGAAYVVDQLEDVATASKSSGGSSSGSGIGIGVTSIFKMSKKNSSGTSGNSNSGNIISFGKDKQAWLYQHRKKVFVLLGLLVIVFGLVIAVMVLTSGDDNNSGSAPSAAEASSVNNNNNNGFTTPDNYQDGGTLGDPTTAIPVGAPPGTAASNTTTSADDGTSSSNTTTTTTTTTLINLMAQLNMTTFPTALLKTRGTSTTSVNGSAPLPALLLDTERGSLQTYVIPRPVECFYCV
jgi:hypothetical protein